MAGSERERDGLQIANDDFVLLSLSLLLPLLLSFESANSCRSEGSAAEADDYSIVAAAAEAVACRRLSVHWISFAVCLSYSLFLPKTQSERSSRAHVAL